ncbi:hypothetical protein [Allostreptomyces psammosilenae]|uniref:Membrane-bound ClpP family serine protease n=1 Tax=Allostreptomyces psammosilenae TaxID=1892865 RepID=A0A852ZTQ7_9ACTN|nr:hypothetical protein [Allostreptomyces psammosilenae]NYI04937.1 membrane-bound ClpP family serine protease [Allostreptomyces psammosilenae]
MSVFLVMGIAGVAVLLVSLLLGGLLDAFHLPFDGGAFSLPVVAAFVSMLGFTGELVTTLTPWGVWPAVAVGAGAGGVAGRGVVALSRFLMRGQSDVTVRGEDLIGGTGRVVTPIPEDGYGEVMLRAGGAPVKYSARSATAVPRGAEVWVVEVLSASAVRVEPLDR